MPSTLWRNSDFRKLFTGQAASQLGEHSSLIILPLIAVLTLDVDATELGFLRAAGQAPQLLFALLVGVCVDRWSTRTVMVVADAGRALAMGAAAVAAFLGGLGLPALLAVAFVVGALSVFFDVAYQASLTRMVERDQLLRGNSALEGSRTAAQIGGPALGGTLAAPVAAAVNALFFVVSVVAIARIGHRERIPERDEGRGALAFVARNELLRAVCLASAAFQFFLAATMTGYLLFLPRELHLGGGAIGLVLGAIAPGALLGSVLAPRLPTRGPALVAAALIGDGAMLGVPLLHGGGAPAVVALIAVNLVFGMFGQLVNVAIMAVRQAVTPYGMQGRVAATISFAGMGMAPLGSLAGGLLAGHLGLRPAVAVAAAGMLLSPVVIALSPLGRRREGQESMRSA